MSKVKINSSNPNVRKSKLRRNLRRIETAKKKKDRIKKYHQNVYPFMTGYYVRDKRYQRSYETVTIPEKIIEDFVIEDWKYVHGYNDEGRLISVYKRVFKTIPEHDVRKCVSYDEIDIPERPIRINTNLKAYRKIAARKLRRKPIDEIYNRGNYKKACEVKWLLW